MGRARPRPSRVRCRQPQSSAFYNCYLRFFAFFAFFDLGLFFAASQVAQSHGASSGPGTCGLSIRVLENDYQGRPQVLSLIASCGLHAGVADGMSVCA